MAELSDKANVSFQSFFIMLRCVRFYIEFFEHEKHFSGTAKKMNKNLDAAIRNYQQTIQRMFDKTGTGDAWKSGIEARDFAYTSNILDECINFSDEQKYTLELFIQELKNGTVKVELDESK